MAYDLVRYNCVWRLVDSVLCLVVFFPSMVFYWRGTWDLYGVYIYPENQILTNWITFAVGCMSVVGYVSHPAISWLVKRIGSSVIHVVVTRAYLYVYAVVNISYWRGVWTLLDLYVGQYAWRSALGGLILSYTGLILLSASRTVILVPFNVILDTRPSLLEPATRFETKVEWNGAPNKIKYVGDACLTQFVIISLTIVSWRSSMRVVDSIMLNAFQDAVQSYIYSLVIGIVSVVLFYALEVPFARLSHQLRNHKWIKLIYEDTVFTVAFFMETFLWRGAWNLNATYVISDKLVGGWVNHCIGTFMLMSLQLFSYVSSCGCARDTRTSSDCETNSFWNTKYLRHYLRKFINKANSNSCSAASQCNNGIVSGCDDNVNNDVSRRNSDVVSTPASLKNCA